MEFGYNRKTVESSMGCYIGSEDERSSKAVAKQLQCQSAAYAAPWVDQR